MTEKLSRCLLALQRRLFLRSLARGLAGATVVVCALALLASSAPFSALALRRAPGAILLVLSPIIICAPFTARRIYFERRLIRLIEHLYPQFEQRLITFEEQLGRDGGSPLLDLLAAEPLSIAQQVERKIFFAVAGTPALGFSTLVASVILFYFAVTDPVA